MSTETPSEAATVTEYGAAQAQRAKAAGATPVMFVHGLYLLPSSWDRWAELFEAAGYVVLTPGWPDDPETTSDAREHPEVLAAKSVGQAADHFATIASSLDRKPAIIGHSFGGLIAQILAGRGLAAVTVAIDPVDTGNPGRGPLLVISGKQDHTVPPAIANASYKHQARNEGVTEIAEMPGRGHALTIDSGWREVADTALTFVQRFTLALPGQVGTTRHGS